MSATRNLFIVGISIFSGKLFLLHRSLNLKILIAFSFSGASLPEYFKSHSQDINFGIPWLDQLLIVLITNSLIVTLIFAFLLDNTIKCENPQDRGMHAWIKPESEIEDKKTIAQVYNLPGIFDKIRPNNFILKIFPIFPSHEKTKDFNGSIAL